MLLSEEPQTGKFKINAYHPGTLTVNGELYHTSMIIGLDKMVSHWAPRSLSELTDAHLLEVLTFDPEIILHGTGKHFMLPSAKQLKVLHQQKMSLECMDTRAACRTYVALAAEERKVVAALLIE